MNISSSICIAFFVGAGLVIGIALTILSIDESVWWKREARLEKGSMLFEADSTEVRLFLYSSDDMAITAQRSNPGVSFAVQVTYTDNRPAQHCISSPDLAGVLPALALTKVRAQIDEKERKSLYPIPLGHIEIKDAVFGEPIFPWLFFRANSNATIAVKKQSQVFETDISPDTIKRIRAGCSGLAKR
jgi:hypothetical protein